MEICPNKSFKSNPKQEKSDWELLIDRVGSEDNAWNEYILNGFDIPIFNEEQVIKEGVQELFVSNPELANAVYEALGFKTKTSENEITRGIKEILPFKVIGDYSNIEEGLTGRRQYSTAIDGNNYVFDISTYSYENEDGTFQSYYDIDFTVNGSEDIIGTGFFDKSEKAKQIIQAIISQNYGNDTIRLNVEESKKGKQRLLLYKRLMNQLGYNPSEEMEYTLFYDIKTDKVNLTPQQKQQAQQLYSRYLESLNKPNTNPILQGNQEAVITPNDKIVFGHPTIGKTFLKEKGITNFISFDDDFAEEINNFVNTHKGSLDKYQYKQSKPKEYIDFSLSLYDKAKAQAKKESKILFTSSNIIFENRINDFDKVINLEREEFFKRIRERKTTYDIVAWKDQIDNLISKVDSNKVINTRLYLSDLLKNAIIKPTDKIIWGHPAIGKSYAAKKVKMIDFDSYKLGINKKYNLYIAPGLSDTELRTDDKTREARENWRYESEENQALWNQFIRDVWQQAKKDAKEQGAILFASDLLVLREFGNEVDKALTMPDELFFERSKQRNNFIEGELGTKVWKGNLNRAVNNFKEKFGEDKVISTEKYLSDLFTNTQQEQVKKFAELQERLNNKEFLEGAKNAFESSEGLRSFGTQEQYNDYIARVSLGIIKNPSSGEYNFYNYNSVENYLLEINKIKKEC